MRTLSADLLAAQRSASTEPQVDVTVENHIGGMRRLEYKSINTTANTLGKHDVCVAGDGSVTRVRSDNAGGILYQRNTEPGNGFNYAGAWTTLVAAEGTQVACAAKGARVMIIYSNAAGTSIKMVESTDNGATYTAPVTVVTPGGIMKDLAVAYKNSTGDCGIAWTTSTQLAIIRRAAGAFGAASAHATGLNGLGVAMTYVFDYELVVTGADAAAALRVWTTIHGDGNDAPPNTWGALDVQVAAETGSNVLYQAPSIVYTDTYRINFTEADSFTGGPTRVYRTTMHPSMTYAAGPFTLRAPVPVDYTAPHGYAVAADANYLYQTAPDRVSRAAIAQVLTTLTPNVIAVHIDEDATATRGYIDLDNSAGTYAGPPDPIAIGNLVGVSWGYRTASGLQSSRMADLWIAAHEYRRASAPSGRSVLRLHLEGGWELLRRSRQRTQVVHTADAYLTILNRIFSRAGLQLTTSAPSSRSTTVSPKFTIAADTSGYAAALAALQFLADRIRMRNLAGALLTEPLASAASDYTFGTSHPLRSVELLTEPPAVTEAQASATPAAVFIYGDAIDYANREQTIGTIDEQRDWTSTGAAAAAATAVAHLRQRALDARAGQLIAPPNCGQELLDEIDFTDLLVSATAVTRRVAGIRWRYDRHRQTYEQTLILGAM